MHYKYETVVFRKDLRFYLELVYFLFKSNNKKNSKLMLSP